MNKKYLDALERQPNKTVDQKLCIVMYRQFSGYCSLDDLLAVYPMDRNTLLMHLRKSVYLEHEEGNVRFHLKGKDIYKGNAYGKLYDDPDNANSVTDFVFSHLWQNPDLSWFDVRSLVRDYGLRKNKPVQNYTQNMFQTTRKGLKHWRKAKE